MPDSENVLVALTGGIVTGPTSATAPTDADSAWAGDFTDLGYISEDGVTESPSDDSTEIKAWQNGQIVRRMITGSSTTYQFTLIETTADGLELYHKGSVVTPEGGGAASIAVKNPTNDRRSFGIDVIDGDNLVRLYIPDGEVTERGDIVYKNDEAIGYQLTVTAYPDDEGIHTYKFFSSLDGVSGS